MIAVKGYDAEARVLAPLREARQTAVIPPKRNRTEQREYDRDLYEARHLIENFFCKLKQFRVIATRYDKTTRNFLTAIYIPHHDGHLAQLRIRPSTMGTLPRRECGLTCMRESVLRSASS